MSTALPSTDSKPPLKDRLQALMVEYGKAALWVYLGIFATVYLGFLAAIHFGIQLDGASGTAGTLGAAYLATKLTQPIRIGATLVVTPLVMRFAPRRATVPRGAPTAREEPEHH